MDRKLLKRVALAGAILFGVTAVGSTSLANPIDVKLPKGMIMVENNPPSIFVDNGSKGVQKALLDKSVLKANVYQLQVKKENNFYYGIVGDVQLGSLAMGTLLSKPIVTPNIYLGGKKEEKESQDRLKEVVSNLETLDDTGKLQLRYQEKTKTYEGVTTLRRVINGVTYADTLHVTVYQHRSYGPSIRFVALDERHDAELYPELSKVMKITR